MVTFARWGPDETDALADLIVGEPWPFHAGTADRDAVRARAADGFYDGPGARTFWIVDGGVRAGMVRLFDLDDGDPMFDLRVRAADRGRGLGTAAVGWLTGYLFTELPAAHRVEATTRSDNVAMQQVLERCGYRKEAHYREAWPVPGGARKDAVGYAILRTDPRPRVGDTG